MAVEITTDEECGQLAYFTRDVWGNGFLPESLSINDVIDHTRFIFKRRGVLSAFSIKPSVLDCFLQRLSSHYFKNPYHNWTHAGHVTLNFYRLLRRSPSLFTDLEKFACLVAAISHDVDHRGVGNAVLVSRGDPLALLYNDISVLENRSASLCFEIINSPGCNITENLGSDEKREFRKIVLDLILTTDIASPTTNHFLEWKLKSSGAKDAFDSSNGEHRLSLLRYLIRLADIGCVVQVKKKNSLNCLF